MKKRGIYIVCLLAILAIGGCDNKKSEQKEANLKKVADLNMNDTKSKDIYNKALDSYSVWKYEDSVSEVTTTVKSEEASMNMKVTYEVKANDIGTPNMKHLAKTTGNIEGEDVKMEVYYEDGYVYYDSDDQHFKAAIVQDEYTGNYVNNKNAASIKYDFMKKVECEKQDDKHIYEYELDETKYLDYMKALGTDGNKIESMHDIKILEAYGKTVINADYQIESYQITMKLDMNIDGNKGILEITNATSYNNPNKPVKIKKKNLKSYEKIEL